MNELNKNKKENDNILLTKSGNISELLKAGRASHINLDISKLSGKGFSNLLEKAKKLQDLKKKDVKSNLEIKKEEFESIVKKGKENIKNNNISLTKIPDNFEILKKFSLRMSIKKNNKLNKIIENEDNLNNTQKDNYFGKSTIADTNSNNNSNFNTEKTKIKENTEKSENGKDNDESSIDYIKKSETNTHIEKKKYFHFYKIFNNLNYKNNNKILIIPKVKQNQNIDPINPDMIYENSDNNEDAEDNNKKNSIDEENVECYEENFNKNININNGNCGSFEYQSEPFQKSTDIFSQDLDNINNSLENNNNIIESSNNSFNNNKKYEELNFSTELLDFNTNCNKEDKEG